MFLSDLVQEEANAENKRDGGKVLYFHFLLFSPGEKIQRCHHKAVEFACSACLFCVFCPLSIVWCCIKLPCKIGCRAAGQARKRFPRCCHCGSEKKFYSSYSSFSDMDDSDIRPSKQEKKNSTQQR
ncbi:hypothetical protein OIU76_021776 [Salix suchowensis]|nr:hypothetical protein OIU76_021776 [Salix suchowensis]